MKNTVNVSPSVGTAKGKPIAIKESRIPFKNAPEWAQYYVRNCNGSETYFEHQPEIEWQHYFCNTGRQATFEGQPKYVPNWRQTIRKRPQGE